MAVCLLILGNFWLAAALVLLVGERVAHTEPTMYSFFGSGSWFYPETYNIFVGLCLLMAAVYFVLSYTVWRRRA